MHENYEVEPDPIFAVKIKRLEEELETLRADIELVQRELRGYAALKMHHSDHHVEDLK